MRKRKSAIYFKMDLEVVVMEEMTDDPKGIEVGENLKTLDGELCSLCNGE